MSNEQQPTADDLLRAEALVTLIAREPTPVMRTALVAQHIAGLRVDAEQTRADMRRHFTQELADDRARGDHRLDAERARSDALLARAITAERDLRDAQEGAAAARTRLDQERARLTTGAEQREERLRKAIEEGAVVLDMLSGIGGPVAAKRTRYHARKAVEAMASALVVGVTGVGDPMVRIQTEGFRRCRHCPHRGHGTERCGHIPSPGGVRCYCVGAP